MNVDPLRDFISQKLGIIDVTDLQYTHKIEVKNNKVYVDGYKIKHIYHQYRGKYIVLYGQPIYLDYRDTIYIIVTHTDDHSISTELISLGSKVEDILVNTTIRIRDTDYVTGSDLTVNNTDTLSIIENTVNNFLQTLSNSITNNVNQVFMNLRVTKKKAYINCEPVKIQRATTHLNASEKVISVKFDSTGNVIIDPITGEIDGNPFGEFSYPVKLTAIIPELVVASTSDLQSIYFSNVASLPTSGRYIILPDIPGEYVLRVRLTSGSATNVCKDYLLTPNTVIDPNTDYSLTTGIVTKLEVQIINKVSLPANSMI